MEHPITPPHAHTLEKLGEEVAKLRYDALLVFLQAMTKELARQQHADERKGRISMSVLGQELIGHLYEVIRTTNRMLKVSFRHMEVEFLNEPLLVPLDWRGL